VLVACNGQRPHLPQGSDHLIIKWEVQGHFPEPDNDNTLQELYSKVTLSMSKTIFSPSSVLPIQFAVNLEHMPGIPQSFNQTNTGTVSNSKAM